MLITELANAYLNTLSKERGMSENTVRAYHNDLAPFIAWLSEKNITETNELEQLKPAQLRAFWAFRRSGGLSAQSMRRGQSAMRGLFKYGIKRRIISKNPAEVMDSPKPRRPLPKALTQSVTETFMNAPETDTLLGKRDKAILELLYGSGLRVSEAAGLSIDDVDLKGKILHITGKGKKTRVVPMTQVSAESLQNYLTARNAVPQYAMTRHIFMSHTGTPLTTRSIARMINKYVMKAALLMHVTPHQFRHSFATDLLNNGADIRAVQDMLGHSNLSTTQIYTKISKEKLMQTYKLCHPRSGLSEEKNE